MSTVISRRRDPTIQKILNVTALGFTKDAVTTKALGDWIKYWSAKFRSGAMPAAIREIGLV